MLGKIIENMVWVDVEKAIKEVPFLLIPLGASQKEHGHHLPMNTDRLMVEYFRDQLLKEFNVLCAATIDRSYFPAFTEYPGSENLELKTAVDLVYQICKSHVKHGITHIYVINMGISTNKVLEQVQEKLKQERILFSYTNQKNFDSSFEIKQIEQQKRGTHAEELETSMMLYIKPDVVNMKKAVKDVNDEIDPSHPGPLTRDPSAAFGVYSPTGAWGDPTLATVEKGKIVVKKYLALLREEINTLLSDCLEKKKTQSYVLQINSLKL